MEKDPQSESASDALSKIGEIIEVVEEGDMVEIIEIEIYGKENKKPPRAKKYKIRIDKEHKVVDHRFPNGTEILGLVGKSPDGWRLFQKLHGGHMREVQPD